MRTLPDTPLRNPYNATTTSNTPNSQATYELSQSTQSTTIESEPTNIINTNPHFHTRNALTSWLTTARRAQRPCNHKGQHAAGSKTSQPGQPKRKHNGHQTTIETQHKSNDHWGDPIDMVAHTPRLRVISRNVNTLNTKQNYLSWRATTQAALDLQADILCLQETNTNWSHNTNTNIKSIFNNTPYRQCRIATSASTDPTSLPYQPGGTLTAALGHWTSKAHSAGADTTGMGRWSYVTLHGENNKRYTFLSGYRVGPQAPQLGHNTTTDQQYRILTKQGQHDPNPRSQFIKDLINQVNQWRQQGHEVMCCLDANEDVETLPDTDGLALLYNETDLVDIHQYCHPHSPRPATHQCGSRPIDICLASPAFIPALTGTYILPFGQPHSMPGDHRTIGIDLDPMILFGHKAPSEKFRIQRGVNSNAFPTVKLFSQLVSEQWERQNIDSCVTQLMAKTTFSMDDHDQLEQLDREITQILVKADKKCNKYRDAPWSPELHQAFLQHRYWRVQLTAFKTKRDFRTVLADIQSRLKTIMPPLDGIKSITSQLRIAQNNFRTIRQQAKQKREDFLTSLLQAAGNTNDKKRRQLISHLKRAEENRHCFALTKTFIRPHSAGGLTNIRVTDDGGTTWQTITDIPTMENHLLQHSQTHFSKAHGAPFTQEPLKSLLQYDGLTPFGDDVFHGRPIPPDLNLPPMTQLLLEHQKGQLQPNETPKHELQFDDLMQGFKKWPERTSTSPSGRHLGIYKSLLKDFPPPTKKEDPKPPERTYGITMMQTIFNMLYMAVRHTHTYDRWKVIWNMFLEKDIGNPQINRLRTLHIIEADYNLLLKWFGAHGFLAKSEYADRLTDAQGGGRKGRSAIDLACKIVVDYDVCRVTKDEATIVSNDLAECFDRMIENCHNLSCRQLGADLQYLKLHAQTQRQQRYYVKHAFGPSTKCNTFSDEHPWYGAGQGAGDASIRWTAQSHSLITAYQSRAHQFLASNPSGSIKILQGLDAYCDDTMMMLLSLGQQFEDSDNLIKCTQENLDLWNGLLEATGGALNPPKSVWAHFQWTTNKHGNLILLPGEPTLPTNDHIPAAITLSRWGAPPSQLRCLLPTEAHRYLGVQLTMDGNSKQELQTMVSRTAKYSALLSSCTFTRREAKVIYRQCFLPAVSYPLPATFMPDKLLDATQTKVNSLFLNRIGYPRTMPKAVTNAPNTHGGIGMMVLSNEQGLQKCIQILKHIRADTATGKMIQILIDYYQLHVGISRPVLEDTTPIPWSAALWLDNARQYLHRIHGGIILQRPWLPTMRREGDRCIMDDVLALPLTPHDAININNTRLYLRVSTLAEITSHDGLSLRSELLRQPTVTFPQQAAFYSPPQSTLQWPHSTTPRPSDWRLWVKTIRRLYITDNKFKLATPLGNWRPGFEIEFQWTWKICPQTFQLHHFISNQWKVYTPAVTKRKYVYYDHHTVTIPVDLCTLVPVTPIISHDRLTITTPLATVMLSPTANATTAPSLMAQLKTPPTEWERPLWHKISAHQSATSLHRYIGTGKRILVVSDASVSHRKIGTSAWVIHTDVKLWSGVSLIPGTQADMNSDIAEAYGLYTALSFLRHYIGRILITYQQVPTIYVCCDNKGVLERITNTIPLRLNPNQTVADEYSIYREIQIAQQALSPLHLYFHHVKGHQDVSKRQQPLPLEAILNIECDKAAALVQQSLPTNHQPPTNQQLPNSFPHLKIKSQIITRQLQKSLRDAATLPIYHAYLSKKFIWIGPQHRKIQWTAFRLAIQRFSPAEQTFIHKFIHEWIPLQTRPQISSTSNNALCPSCRQLPEDTEHFFKCKHPDRTKALQKLHNELQQLFQKYAVDPHMFQLLWQGVRVVTTDIELPPPEEQYPPIFTDLFLQQQQLGWKQLMYGRISHSWATYIETRPNNINGSTFYAKIIQYIWTYALCIWQTRNQHLHNSNEQYDQTRLEATVRQIFHDAEQHPTTASLIRQQTPESILAQPIKYIQNWATRSASYMRDQTTAAAKRARLGTHDIRSFFTTQNQIHSQPHANNTDKNLLRPP